MKKVLWLLAPLAILACLMLTGDSVSRSVTSEQLASDPVADAIDEALYQKVALVDTLVDFPRPAAEAEEKLIELLAGQAPDDRIYRVLADVQTGLGKSGEAEQTMLGFVRNSAESETSLKQLAEFYGTRLEPEKQVAAYQRLAEKQTGEEKVATLRHILALADDFLLADVDRVANVRLQIEAEPDKPEHIETLIDVLVSQGSRREALREADAALARFPERRRAWLSRKASILREAGRLDEAAAVYDLSYDPVGDLDLFNDYLGLLGELERRTQFDRELRRAARLGRLDPTTRPQHFLLLRGRREYDDAAKALDRWIAGIGRLSEEQLTTFADAYSAIGKSKEAWRLAYTLYVTASGGLGRERALARLFDLTWELPGWQLNITAGGCANYISRRHLDSGPGVAGGVLSLLYNKQGFAERLEDLGRVGRDLANRRFLARLFERMRADFPQSEHLAGMFARMVRMYDEYNKPAQALALADQFMQAYPDDPGFYEVAEAAVVSYRRLNRKADIAETYRALIRRADGLGERDNYFKYLSSLIQLFVADRQFTDAVAQYWTEIDAHPRDEQLYSRFLEFLGRYRIYDEELKVYERAIEQFDDSSYYHRLARWYTRQRRTADFQDLTRRVADIFADSELARYFSSFLQQGRSAADPDSVFFRTMYEYALGRFPRNMRFVEGLLTFYERFSLDAEFDALSKRYFYASPSIRRNWIRSLSRRGLLAQITGSLTGGAALPVASGQPMQPPESAAERLLLAEIARWGSHYEAAVPLYQDLYELYPGDKDLAGILAGLHRSFGQAEQAEALYTRLSSLFPTDKEFPTKAGEVLVESGQASRAAEHWMRILQITPSSEELYLEVASIFWDYYMFDRSAQVLLAARERLDQPTLFGSKLAAVYESAKDYPKAVAEYVHTVAGRWDRYYEKEEPLRRLVYLARRKGMGEQIDSAFAAAIAASRTGYNYTRAYADYLAATDQDQRRLRELRESINRYEQIEYLNWLADTFRAERRGAEEEAAIRRVIRLEGPNSDNLRRLAGFLERAGRLDDAQSIHSQRVELTRTDQPEELSDWLAALDDAANFAWRHERFDDAFSWWETAARAASGYPAKTRLHSLAQRLIERERFEQATAIVEELLREEPTATRYFNTLAQVYRLREDYPGLRSLYSRAIEAVRADTGISAEAKTARIAELRYGMIEIVDQLGDRTAALDQYIEIINRSYNDDGAIGAAARYAEQHNLLDRLNTYYEQTSERSYKDFRWNYVLARIYEHTNRLADAAEQWRSAVRNEPQRINLRLAQASTLLKLQRFDEAVAVYREVWRLDRRSTAWLQTIARTQALAGDTEGARQTLESILEGDPPGYRKYFEVAQVLESWGDLDGAAEKLEAGLTRLRADIYTEQFRRADLNLYISVGAKRGEADKVFGTLLDLNTIYTREAARQGNARAWMARQGQNITYSAFSGSFAEALRQYAGEAELRAIVQRMTGYIDQYPDNKNTVAFVRSGAQAMGLAGITERAIALQLGHLNTHNERYNYRRAILEALDYFGERGQWRAAAQMLERELGRSTMFHFKQEMLGLLVDLYRYGGDAEGEIRALNRYWSETGGDDVGFSAYDLKVSRYLELLLARADEPQLRQVSRSLNAYTGQCINYFLAHGRTDLATMAVNTAALRRTPKWRDSKLLLLDAYAAADPAALAAGAAERLMDVRPAGQRLDQQPDTQRVLAGSEWFAFAPHFARYLFSASGDPRYTAFAIAAAESSPRSADAQRAVATWYEALELYGQALTHLELALQLGGGRNETYALMGRVHFKSGNRQAALAAWGGMLEGEPGQAAYQRYFEVLYENGLKQESLDAITQYLERALAEGFSWQLRDLLYSVNYTLEADAERELLVGSLLRMAPSADEPLEVISFVAEEISLSPELRLTVLERAVQAAARQGQGDGADGPNPMLRYWLEEAIDFAVSHEDYRRARGWIESYEANGLLEDQSYRFSRNSYFWQLKARTLLALGEEAAADTALRKIWQTDRPSIGNYQVAYEILKSSGELARAEELLIGYYRWALSQGLESQSNYTGLAAVLLDRAERLGGADGEQLIEQADSLLDRMAGREPNNAQALAAAARLLDGRGLTSRALRYRQMLRRLEPDNADNLLALADGFGAAGRGDEALDIYRGLLLARQVPKQVKLEAREGFLQIISGSGGPAADDIARFAAASDSSELAALVHAELLLAGGREQAFRDALDAALAAFHEPALLIRRRAQAELEAGNTEDAIDGLRQALAFSPQAAVRLELLTALLDAGRNVEALGLLDSLRSQDLTTPNAQRLNAQLGIEKEDLLGVLDRLALAATQSELWSEALELEGAKKELAAELGAEVTDRAEQIRRLQQQAWGPESPVRIVDRIAN